MFTELTGLVYLSTPKHTGHGGAFGRGCWMNLWPPHPKVRKQNWVPEVLGGWALGPESPSGQGWAGPRWDWVPIMWAATVCPSLSLGHPVNKQTELLALQEGHSRGGRHQAKKETETKAGDPQCAEGWVGTLGGFRRYWGPQSVVAHSVKDLKEVRQPSPGGENSQCKDPVVGLNPWGHMGSSAFTLSQKGLLEDFEQIKNLRFLFVF